MAIQQGKATPNHPPNLMGMIASPAGVPFKHAFIRAGDMKTGAEAALGAVDPSGHFALNVPPGDYALAVVSEHGFAYVEHIAAPTTDVAMMFSSECTPARGRLLGKVLPGTTVVLSRVSNFAADRFVVAVESSGEFNACLPNGSYTAAADGNMKSFQVRVQLPAQGLIELPAYARSAIETTPQQVSFTGDDFGSFVHALQHGPRVLGLGEANHGTGDFYKLRGALSLALARTGDLRLVLLEADAISMFAIDDYVQGKDIEIKKAVGALEFWITDIQEFLNFLREARGYNQAVPEAERIHILGFDAQNTTPPSQLLIKEQGRLGISEAETELLGRISSKRGQAFASFSSEDARALESMLDRLSTNPPAGALLTIPVRAAIAARSLRLQLGYVGKATRGELRDAAMAELTALIIDLGGSGRASLWAHNGHLAREPDGTTTSLGQHLAERFGAEYCPIAFLSYSGTARAWDAAGEIGVIAHELDSPSAYNVESVIMSALHFPDIAWVRFDTTPFPLKQWLQIPRYTREFGSAYIPKSTQTLRQFPRAFVAVVVVKHALASTPTPTGERHVKS